MWKSVGCRKFEGCVEWSELCGIAWAVLNRVSCVE